MASSEKEAVKLAVNAGIDMAMIPYNFKFCDYLYELVQEGEVNESRIDDAVRRILALKFRLGLFDSSYDHYEEYPEFGSKTFQNLEKLSKDINSEIVVIVIEAEKTASIVFCCISAWIQPDISGCQQDFLVVWKWNQLRTF